MSMQLKTMVSEVYQHLKKYQDEDNLPELSVLVRTIAEQVEKHSPAEIVERVDSMQNVMKEIAVARRPEEILFSLLYEHGEALSAILHRKKRASEFIARSVSNSVRILDKAASEGRPNSGSGGGADGTS
ncbi:MAG: hypothetical protein CMM31_08230 [Rhodospirillaceae bacterium]|nr:hypothetical protein [Rhodospirillaceae bacterium]